MSAAGQWVKAIVLNPVDCFFQAEAKAIVLKLTASELSLPQNRSRQNFDLRTELRGIATIVQQAACERCVPHAPALEPSVRLRSQGRWPCTRAWIFGPSAERAFIAPRPMGAACTVLLRYGR